MSSTDFSTGPAAEPPIPAPAAPTVQVNVAAEQEAAPATAGAIDPNDLATAIVSALLKQPVATAPPPPPFVQALVISAGQKALAALAALLTGYGLIAPTKQAIVISLGLSALAWTASFLWTFGRDFLDHQNLVKATNALPPVISAK